MELTYKNMMEFMKKYWDIMRVTTPETKDKFRELLTDDYECEYAEGMGPEGETDHIANHYNIYRAACLYEHEPDPLGIFIDERKKVATTILREEARHPVTGELVKAFPLSRYWGDSMTGKPYSVIYLICVHGLTLVDNQIKAKYERVAWLPVTSKVFVYE